jgi:hypothetical protein
MRERKHIKHHNHERQGSMADVIKELEDRINGDILAELHKLYTKVGSLAVPVEESIAGRLRTLLGEGHQIVDGFLESPIVKEAAAKVLDAASQEQGQGEVKPAVAEHAQGAAPGEVAGAGQAPGGGAGAALSQETQDALAEAADAYEEERERILAGGSATAAAESPAAGAQADAPPLPSISGGAAPTGEGGSPTGSV